MSLRHAALVPFRRFAASQHLRWHSTHVAPAAIAARDNESILQQIAKHVQSTKDTPALAKELPTVNCVVRARLPTNLGTPVYLHLYKNSEDDKEHMAMVFGKSITSRSLTARRADDTSVTRVLRGVPNDSAQETEEESSDVIGDALSDSPPPLVRVHSECFTGENAFSARCDCGDQLATAAKAISSQERPNGVIVYLRQEGRGIGLANKLKAYNLQDQGADTLEANVMLGFGADQRSYGVATSILCDLGLNGERGIRLLTNNPDKVSGIRGPEGEVRVRELVPMPPSSCKSGDSELRTYLQTKVEKMGHTITL
ncbi:hypothetical protein BST61_g9465 [Cercospora zeina]